MVCSDENKYKYLIGYKDDDHKPLSIMLPKTSTYVRRYGNETKWMNFLSKDDNLEKKFNDIWNRISNGIKKT